MAGRVVLFGVAVVLLLGASLPDLPPPPYAADHPYIGSWVWTRQVNDCIEYSQNRPDGTTQYVSGTSRGESRFRITREPDWQGFYIATDEITRTTDGRDCSDSGEPTPVGDIATSYLFFISQDEMLVCYERSLKRCFGPLKRVQQRQF